MSNADWEAMASELAYALDQLSKDVSRICPLELQPTIYMVNSALDKFREMEGKV